MQLYSKKYIYQFLHIHNHSKFQRAIKRSSNHTSPEAKTSSPSTPATTTTTHQKPLPKPKQQQPVLVAQQPTPVIKKEATTPVSVVVEATVADTADTPVVDDEAEDVQVVADATEPYVSIISFFCLLYTSPSPRDGLLSRMPSSA